MGAIAKIFAEAFSLSGEPPDWFYRWSGGGPSKTGLHVSEQTALRFTAVFACIRILSETLASMPIILYKDRKIGDKASGKDRAVDHPLYDLLKTAPNKEMPSMILKETMQSHIAGSGNGYSHIQRNRRGTVLSLSLIPWTFIDPRRNLETWEIEYWTNDRGKMIILPSEEVFHIPGLGFDGVKGYSPIYMAKEAIGLGLAAEMFGASFFANGASVSGVAEYPGKLSDNAFQRFKQSIREEYAGLGNTKKVMFLEEGLKFHQVTIPPNEAQFIETRKFQVEEIARLYRIPMHLLQNLERSTNNNIEHQSLEFVMYTMLPWFTRWEQFINFKLLTPDERAQGYFAEFLINALMRGDTVARAQMLHLMRQDGVICADEWRELENMNPQENGQGKYYFINGNMIPTEIAAAQKPKNKGGGNQQ
ncbi:MAG: phage portal protein [Negativicutes bacterium]|nr:phage portal protein [Negativicutes bacterium]